MSPTAWIDALGPETVAAFERDYGSVDPGIARAVMILRAHGVDTFESCQGGDGHSQPDPIIRFRGGKGAGWAALAVALDYALPVRTLRQSWPIDYDVPTGPYWELTFRPPEVSE